MDVIKQKAGESWMIYNGDCIEVLSSIPDDSIGYSIFSPPFSSLYTYSNSERDMGNCKTDEEFQTHFKFLVDHLFRIIQPGRLVSIHCMQIPAMKERDGYIGLKDFRGDIIRMFQASGFIYHGEVTIWKDPLIEATRTKALGLMHKQLCKDSSMCRQGLPDYIVTMRKPGENKNLISHPEGLIAYAGSEARRIEAAFLMDWDEAIHMDDLFTREREIKRKEAEFARIEAEAKAKAEAERLEKEKAEREERIRKEAAEKAEREAKEKIEAEKQRALKAEADAKAAAEKAERNRIAAEERAKLEAIRVEEARLAAEKQAEIDKQNAIKKAVEEAEQKQRAEKEAEAREAARIKAEEERKASDKKHQARINNEVLVDLMAVCGLPELGAKAIIEAVAKGKIKNMRIQY